MIDEPQDDKKNQGGSLEITGHLGDVMKESAHIAYTYAKSHLNQVEPLNNTLHQGQIHLHVPEVRVGYSSDCGDLLALKKYLHFMNITT